MKLTVIVASLALAASFNASAAKPAVKKAGSGKGAVSTSSASARTSAFVTTLRSSGLLGAGAGTGRIIEQNEAQLARAIESNSELDSAFQQAVTIINNEAKNDRAAAEDTLAVVRAISALKDVGFQKMGKDVALTSQVSDKDQEGALKSIIEMVIGGVVTDSAAGKRGARLDADTRIEAVKILNSFAENVESGQEVSVAALQAFGSKDYAAIGDACGL